MTTKQLHIALYKFIAIRLTRWNLFPAWRVWLIEHLYELRK